MRNPIIVAAVIAAALASAAGAQTSFTTPVSQIVTAGSGEASIAPDRATIQIGVQSRATTAAAASTDNARRQKAIIDTLRALGLSPEQIRTMNYSVSPDMQYNQTNGTSRVVGYVVSNVVQADVRRLDDAGKLIDAALAKGANQINSLQFYSSKADSVRRSALAVAVANARADAEALARAAGGSVGQLIELSTASLPVRPIAMDMGAMTMAKMAPTPIEPGEQTVNATVTARWTFIPR
jgi:uncharacterized protein YggE